MTDEQLRLEALKLSLSVANQGEPAQSTTNRADWYIAYVRPPPPPKQGKRK